MKKKKKITIEKAEQILKQIAIKHHTTVDEVKLEIRRAMFFGMINQSPEVQAKWASIPHEGDVLTEEELLIYLSGEIKQ